MANIASVEVVAAVNQFQTDMKSAGQAFAQIMKGMAGANAPVQDAAKATEKSHDGLLSKLKEFKGEQTQQGRMARFYAGELMSIVPAGDGAKNAVQGLLGVLIEGAAGGASFGLALEAIKLSIGFVTDKVKESAAEQKKVFDAASQQLTQIADKAESLRRKLIGTKDFQVTGGQKEAAENIIGRRDRDKAALAALDARFGAGEFAFGSAEYAKQTEEWKRLTKSVEEDTKAIKDNRLEAVAAALGTQRTQEIQAEAKDESEAGAKLDAERRALLARFKGERARAEEEYQAKLAETDRAVKAGSITQLNAAAAIGNAALERKNKLTEITRNEQDQLAALKGQYDVLKATNAVDRAGAELANKLLEIRTKLERMEMTAAAAAQAKLNAQLAYNQAVEKERLDRAQEQGLLDAKTTPTEDQGQDLSKTSEQVASKYDEGARTRAIAKAKHEMQEMAAVGQQMGQVLGDVFIGMASGAMSFGQAVAKVMQQVVQLVVQAAIRSITAHAAEAGAGAAASQAGVPIFGPVLAISAMGAMVAAVLGLIGNIGSASGGFDIPAGVNPLTQLHQEEMVLPAHIANPLRAALAGGGALGGGANITLNIHALDGRSVYRTLKDSESDVMRFLREAVNGGRA